MPWILSVFPGIVGDTCAADADCSDAFNDSSCVTGRCACDVGFYASDDGAICVARKAVFTLVTRRRFFDVGVKILR